MAWPAVKKDFQQEPFRAYVEALPASKWRPTLIVLHNTAAPTMAQWHETADKDRAAGRVPGTTRINNLERYFRDEKGWSGAPHLFVASDRIWVFNPLTAPGTHTPSWNPIAIGIEMVADFDREDDDAGEGLLVRRNTVYAAAVLCREFGLDPKTAVKMHRDDPETTHACPGVDFFRDRFDVLAEIAALMDGGEHASHDLAVAIGAAVAPPPPPVKRGVTIEDRLNFRRGPGISFEATGSLPKNTQVEILDKQPNGSTGWAKVKTPGGYVGWVAARFVKEEAP